MLIGSVRHALRMKVYQKLHQKKEHFENIRHRNYSKVTSEKCFYLYRRLGVDYNVQRVPIRNGK